MRLLDLSARNPLLNYTHPRASSLRIVDEVPTVVLDALIANRTYRFDVPDVEHGDVRIDRSFQQAAPAADALSVVCRTSFDDIVRRAGGVNEAAARGIDKFPKLNAEQVLAWDPDVIVSGYLPGEADAVRARLRTAPGVAQTIAARRNQIVLLETRRMLAVSQYVVDAVDQIAASLDAFEKPR